MTQLEIATGEREYRPRRVRLAQRGGVWHLLCLLIGHEWRDYRGLYCACCKARGRWA